MISKDSDGEAVRDRMSSLMFNLSQLKNNPEAVLVFDEAQDLFKNYGSPAFFAMNAAPSNAGKGNKGLTNKLLESNQTKGEANSDSMCIGRAISIDTRSEKLMPIRFGTNSPKISVR